MEAHFWTLMLVLATFASIQSTVALQTNKTQSSKISKPKLLRQPNEWRRISGLNLANSTTRPPATFNSSKVASKEVISTNSAPKNGSNNNFQSRMMQTDLMHIAPADWQSPQSHLLPTFVDQEQGDEMVALASEHESEEPSSELGLIESHQLTKANKFTNKGNATRKSPHEDYYPEDDDQDEIDEMAVPQAKSTPKQELKSTSDPAKSQASPAKSQTSIESSSPESQISDYYNSPDSLALDMRQNQSISKLTPEPPKPERTWLPAAFKSATTKQPSNNMSKPTKLEVSPKYSTAEKLAHLFGGAEASGGALSKADMAIEYLKNMLRLRQNSTTSLPAASSVNVAADQKQQLAKVNNGARLDGFASRLNQLPKQTVTDQSTTPTVTPTQTSHSTKPQLELTQDKLQPIGLRGLLGFARDNKFPAVDASARQVAVPSPDSKVPANSNTAKKDDQFVAGLSRQNNGDIVDVMDDYTPAYRAQNPSNYDSAPFGLESQNIAIKQHQDSAIIAYDSPKFHQTPVKEPVQSQSQVYKSASYHPSPSSHQKLPLDVPQSSRYFRLEKAPEKSVNYAQSTATRNNVIQAHQQLGQQMGTGFALYPNQNASPVTKLNPVPEEAFKTPPKAAEQTYTKSKQVVGPKERKITPQTSVQAIVRTNDHVDRERAKTTQSQTHLPAGLISSKIYRHEYNLDYQPEYQPALSPQALAPQPVHQIRPNPNHKSNPHHYNYHPQQHQQQLNHHQHQYQPQQHSQQSLKQPRIVSYNYYESPTPNEYGHQGDLMATNYQLGDALYSSSGGVEQTLSNGELDAIQNQFISGEHALVPLNGATDDLGPYYGNEPRPMAADMRDHQANSGSKMQHESERQMPIYPAQNSETDPLKVLSSNDESTRYVQQAPALPVPLPQQLPQPISLDDLNGRPIESKDQAVEPGSEADSDVAKIKRKSLIVYLNHPRPNDMSKVSPANNEGYNLAQAAIGEQTAPDAYVSAKEFDSHGLSKESKQLDVSSLQDYEHLKDGQDKDGLSVVVIGDAYKYKKIVLLISSKSGGLKFIPMVKDMKK